MSHNLSLVTYLVHNYDQAIAFFTECMNFTLVEDLQQSETKRWVVVAPKGQSTIGLVLAKANKPEQIALVGKQAAGRVFLFLHTDHIEEDYALLQKKEVVIIQQPIDRPHGRVLIFEDLYGNKWDLIQKA